MDEVVSIISDLIADLSPETHTILANLLQPIPEPLAIIGVACRFPGHANNPQAFWHLLANGIDGISTIPLERWEEDFFYSADPLAPGKATTRWGGFIDKVDQFDPQFFGISAREAPYIDPQQRLILEVAWEALENAGQILPQITGSNTGVFIGTGGNDYGFIQCRDLSEISGYTGTGITHSIIANRLSYVLDLKGPSMAIDTACSSSLVALHLACQSLRRGECRMALTGGVNLILSPEMTIAFSKAQMMSPDGHCKTYDATANGYVRGEGCGLLVLKRLTDAIADGDEILALVKGSAVNQDGRTASLTAPNGLSQQAVIKQALANAKVKPEDISYIEGHGTGTALGDPIEVEALAAVYGEISNNDCAIGSVKTNIGHLEIAAGVAGVIKVVLALKHHQIPPHINFKNLSPYISLAGTRFFIPKKLTPWRTNDDSRLAAVSSFGFGGTNSHIILAEYPTLKSTSSLPETTKACLLPISARSAESLKLLAQDYQELLGASSDRWLDICYSAGAKRSHHHHRLALVAKDRQEMINKLSSFTQKGVVDQLYTQEISLFHKPKLVFVCAGQGPQWWAMGRQLFEQEPIFRAVIEECAALMKAEVSWSLLAEFTVSQPESRMDRTEVAQPALFAIAIGLAALLKEWGIEPSAVVGHSVGEVAAAYIAGMLTLKDALKIVCQRGRLMERTRGQGKTALIALPLKKVEELLLDYAGQLGIAAINGPNATVVSGDTQVLTALIAQLEAENIFARLLPVEYAFHSPQMMALQQELSMLLSNITPKNSSIPMISTVTGKPITGSTLNGSYWSRNLREPVAFFPAIEELLKENYTIFLELTPHPVLSNAIGEAVRLHNKKATILATLRREQAERDNLLDALAGLYAAGCDINWPKLFNEPVKAVSLPTYHWNHQRFWLPESHKPSSQPTVRRSLFTSYTNLSFKPDTHIWETKLSLNDFPYLADHIVVDRVIVPGATYVGMLLTAISETFGEGTHTIKDISFQQPLSLNDNEEKHFQLVVSLIAPTQLEFSFASSISDKSINPPNWLIHATGQVVLNDNTLTNSSLYFNIEEIQARCTTLITKSVHYENLREHGLTLGRTFQALETIWQQENEGLGRLKIDSELQGKLPYYQMHPTLIDACFQTCLASLPTNDPRFPAGAIYIPVGIDAVTFFKAPNPNLSLWAHVLLTPHSSESGLIGGDIQVFDEQASLIMSIKGLYARRVEEKLKDLSYHQVDNWFYQTIWLKQELSPVPITAPLTGTWLIFTDRVVGKELASQLSNQGANTILISASNHYQRQDNWHYQVDIQQPEQLQQLLKEIFLVHPLPCVGIVHLWSLDIAATDLAQGTATTIGILHLVQTLAQIGWRDAARLYLVTQHAQIMAGDSACQLAATPIWGLAKVIAHEYPEMHVTCLDVAAETSNQIAGQLLKELSPTNSETQIVLRPNYRYLARLTPYQTKGVPQQVWQIQTDATYLITGGTGGLGLVIAQWLITQGAQHLILVSRNEPNLIGSDKIAVWIQQGVNIRVIKADISSQPAVHALIDQIQTQHPILKGIIHAAGVLADATLLKLTDTQFHQVMAAKALGAWYLHQETLNLNLDYFILCSSATTILGAPGQGNYVAANTYLDALAHYRQSKNLPALSINWGPWAEVGMAAAENQRGGRLAARGIASLKPTQAMLAWERILSLPVTQLAVIDFDLKQWRQTSLKMAALPFFSLLVEKEKENEKNQPSKQPTENIKDQLLSLPIGIKRQEAFQQYLINQAAQVLRVAADKIALNIPLSSFGLDSLMAMELVDRLEDLLNITLSNTLLWTYPTIETLSNYLAHEIGVSLQVTELPAATVVAISSTLSDSPDTDLIPNMDDLSVDDMANLLAAKLAQLDSTKGD